MKFLCLFHFTPDAFDGVTPEEMRRIDDATIEHDHKLRTSGHLLLASPLEDVSTEVTIDRRPVRLSTVDGPFAETKEVVGGVVLVEARDAHEARALFDDDPIAPFCRIQIRPLRETHRHSVTGEARPDFVPPNT
ncbi:MAG TPA: YciI family protein [Devosia sp.]|jgi:hypothetical protein|uniref:YciI family protein n=1 Tax=Devosia sp. TaxID=1871048 RepID=UPI002F95EED5